MSQSPLVLKLSQNNTLFLCVHYDAYTVVRILRLNAPLWENPRLSSSVRNLVATVGENSVSLLICVFAYSIKQRLIPAPSQAPASAYRVATAAVSIIATVDGYSSQQRPVSSPNGPVDSRILRCQTSL